MTNRIKPVETTDRYGNVTLAYDIWKIDPEGQVQAVCVSRTLTGYETKIIFRNPINAWSAEIPQGQWGPGLSTLCGKLDEFGCLRFEIAEPPRRLRNP
jgi:hypothetical protein